MYVVAVERLRRELAGGTADTAVEAALAVGAMAVVVARVAVAVILAGERAAERAVDREQRQEWVFPDSPSST